MRTRITLVVIGLVILPAAVLSLVAGRILTSWELVLQRGLEAAVANAVESVADQVQLDLAQDLKRVKAAVPECLGPGDEKGRIDAASDRLRRSGGMIGRVFVFVNPLGFVYPPPAFPSAVPPGMSRSAGTTNRQDSLAAALRREIAAAGPSADTVRFAADDASYFFSPVRDRKDVYVGYEVDRDRFARQLAELIADVSGGGFTLVAEGPGLKVEAPRQRLPADVVITDAFGGRTDSRDLEGNNGGLEPLAVGRLNRPVDFIRLSAFVNDPDAIARAREFRVRLYGWGILLMAAVIIAGVWLLWREAAAEIRRARARSDFVIGVSHDLRTPLASVRMLAESLYMGRVAEAEKQKQFLATIVRECQRLSQLIERVLFFVRFGQDALVHRPRDTDIGALVTREVEAFRASVSHVTALSGASAPGKGEAISLAVEPGLSRIMADDGAIAQIVLNLLDNAWKYGRPPPDARQPVPAEGKGREIEDAMAVEVRAVVAVKKRRLWGRRRKWIRISVSDHGEGIRRSDLRKIFRPFYRGQGARDRNTSGVGLGLALCRHVALAHGGWIEAESEVGKGSSFRAYLPAERGSAGVSG